VELPIPLVFSGAMVRRSWLTHVKPTLKAHGTKRLKLKCDKLLSIFAFNCYLRRYTVVEFAGFHVNLHARAQEVLQCPRQALR